MKQYQWRHILFIFNVLKSVWLQIFVENHGWEKH